MTKLSTNNLAQKKKHFIQVSEAYERDYLS